MNVFTVEPADDAATFAKAHRIRQVVFVEEQACPPELEWDEHDAEAARGVSCFHLIGYRDGEAMATARWRPVGERAKLERFAVLEAHRGGGIGRQLVAATMAAARAAGYRRFVLHAQAHLEAFYESFGFARTGRLFDEAGIEHVKMVLNEEAGSHTGG